MSFQFLEITIFLILWMFLHSIILYVFLDIMNTKNYLSSELHTTSAINNISNFRVTIAMIRSEL